MYTIIKQLNYPCVWCDRAKSLLESHGIGYVVHSMTKSRLLVASSKARMKTVPIIYKGETLIGGYNELQNHLEEQRKKTTDE